MSATPTDRPPADTTTDHAATDHAATDHTATDHTATDHTASTYIANVTVTGMTCGHCVAAVTEEVSKIDGVSSVDVDLASGAVTIRSTQPVDVEAVADAVDEAGYAVAP